jgi:hypothetical protein
MEWSSTLSTLVKFAPGALALIPGVGPIASAAASVLGPSIAQALGVEETPEAVEAAIQAMPAPEAQQIVQDVVAKKGNEVGAAIADAEAKMIAEINATSREELKSESWFVKHARPFNIWVIGFVTAGYGACLVAATAQAVFSANSAALGLLVSNAGVLGIALAPCGAVAGITAWGRTQEKMAGVSGALAGVAKSITSKVKGKS